MLFKTNKDKDEEKQKSQAANVGVSAGVAVETADTTSRFNNECDSYCKALRAKSATDQSAVNEKLNADPSYVGDRSKGVDTAWGYERADVKMGGNGSAAWTKSERQEILEKGTVRGAEGHHTNNVADHPEMQTNPDNITFYKSRKTHLHDGHGGDFHNSSSGPLVDKDKMLKDTNTKRVIKNEAKGLGVSALFGIVFGVGGSIKRTCDDEGYSFKSVKKGIKSSGKDVAESTAYSVGSYTVARVFSFACDRLLKRF